MRFYLLGLLLLISPTSLWARSLPEVVVDPVIEMSSNQTREAIGRVVSQEGGIISTEISGLVNKVFIKVGDILKKDAPIAKLDTDRLTIELKLAKAKKEVALANQNSAKLDTELAESNLQRQTQLVNTPAYSKALVEDLENALKNAKANLTARSAEYDQKLGDYELAQLNLSRATIKAPFNGIVTRKLIHPGVYITPGQGLIELVNNQQLEVEIDVPRVQLTSIGTNQTFQVFISDEQTENATLRTIILEENEISRTIPIRLKPSETLLPKLIVNQSISVLVPLQTAESVLTVHKDSLLSRHSAFYVYVIQDKVAKMRPITIGNAIGNRFIVTSGLSLNDKVVVRGNERLRPNQPVSYKLLTP